MSPHIKFSKFNKPSGDINFFIVIKLWSGSHAVEVNWVEPKVQIKGVYLKIRVVPTHIIDINAYIYVYIHQ